MDPKTLKTISKYLSLHLRHQPQAIGLTLQPGGWVNINDLLTAINQTRQLALPLTQEILQTVVTTSDKQRFSISSDSQRIRANQGHSVPVDLQLSPKIPPQCLYHGTAANSAPAILAEGLSKMARHHVHLSSDPDTAKTVGSRHGRPIIFEIAAATMHHDGFSFYCSENGVWLVDHVPVEYLSQLN